MNTGEMQDLYEIAILLFIYCSTVDVLLHCSPAIAMSKWPIFCCLNVQRECPIFLQLLI